MSVIATEPRRLRLLPLHFMRSETAGRWLHAVVPITFVLFLVVVWEIAVRELGVSKVILPAPSVIGEALAQNWPVLLRSLAITFSVMIEAFLLAVLSGIGMSVIFARFRILEMAVFPLAVILQVTPMIAIAPLLLIWVGLDHVDRALLILATVVAFFPILSNTTLGLRSVDHNLRDLFLLNRATSWQRLVELELPSSLPYILGGMKISGGLALIGSVVAEFVAGSGSATGLAWRIVEAANDLDTPRMFAALFLLSGLGVFNFAALTALQHLLLRTWHESAVRTER